MADYVMTVDITSPESIELAKDRIRQIVHETIGQLEQFMKDLAEIGRRAAQGAYGGAVSVTVEEYSNGIQIRANGDAVVFLEFGAGSAVDTANIFAGSMPFEVRPGSYSEVHYDPTTNAPRPNYYMDGYWNFGGVDYREVQPRNGMERAYEAMMQDMRSAAERAFG